MKDGPAAALPVVDGLISYLSEYHLAHAVRADLHRRLGNTREAAASYKKALALAKQEPERRFLERRLSELKR